MNDRDITSATGTDAEAAIEAEIQARERTAPRLTPATLDQKITAEQYHVFPGTTLTVCALTLENGYCVTGESAAVSRRELRCGDRPESRPRRSPRQNLGTGGVPAPRTAARAGTRLTGHERAVASSLR